MNTLKENIVKSQCFKAAATLIGTTLNPDFDYEEVTKQVYGLAMKLFDGGKKSYWLSFEEYKESNKKLEEFKDGKEKK